MKRKIISYDVLPVWLILAAALWVFASPLSAQAQERRAKVRISNATFSFTALPLIAARDWKSFSEQALDVEIIIMTSSVAAPAMSTGDIDFVSGVGPASVSATLSGLPSRAV